MPDPIERPAVLQGATYTVPTKFADHYMKLYITVNGINGRPLEVIIVANKEGAEFSGLADCIATMISMQLQDGADARRLAMKHLVGVRSGEPVIWPEGETFIHSIPDAIGKTIIHWMETNPPKPEEPEEPQSENE